MCSRATHVLLSFQQLHCLGTLALAPLALLQLQICGVYSEATGGTAAGHGQRVQLPGVQLLQLGVCGPHGGSPMAFGILSSDMPCCGLVRGQHC